MTDRIEEIRKRLDGADVHLPSWLESGITNCRNGSPGWATSYLVGARREILSARRDIPYLLDQIAAKDAEIERLRAIVSPKNIETIEYVQRYGGRCRECADEFGICPGSGFPCGDSAKPIKSVLASLSYGIEHGFLKGAS